MKRFFALMAVVLAVVSCQKDVDNLDVNVGGEQLVNITVGLPEATRASSGVGALENGVLSNYDLRYILEIYRVEGTEIQYDSCQRFVENSTQKQIVFPVRLVAGRDYKIVAWADIVDKGSKEDRYYYTQDGLDNILLIDNGTVNWNAMDETRDAYTAEELISNFNSSSPLNLTLTRPFAKVRVIATDIVDVLAVGIEPTTATVQYIDTMPKKYNAVADGGKTSKESSKSHSYAYATTATKYDDNTGEYTLFADYVFVPQSGTAKFSLDVFDAQGRSIKNNAFNTEIFVERNKVTTIKGDVLTTGGNVIVKVEDEFDGETEIKVVDTPVALQEVINNIKDGGSANIELGGNIDLGAIAGILSTRSAATLPLQIPEGKTLVLDLNGFTITTPWEDESAQKHYYAFENHGTLTIKDSSEEGDGKIVARGNFNYGTMTLESGTIDACDGNGGYGVRNYAGTFVMNGGAIITSLEDDNNRDNGGYDATPIRVDEEATATINGGVINNISDYTFAIENYGTTTINGGTFTTVHSTIANMGTMTIKGNATTIKCEGKYDNAHPIYANGEASVTTIENGNIIGNDKASCYYVAVEDNSTVYISGGTFTNAGQAAFTGKGTIVVTGGQFDKDPSARVADGYKVVEDEDNGRWAVVVDPVAKIGDTEYATLEAAIAAAKEGNTITVLRDATLTAGLTIPADVIFNGNGKQINGELVAGGDVTFVGHTKVTAFSASYYNRTITIGEGACLEITGSGRVSLAYGNTFNITGSVEEAKTADKANIQPSLIIPAGISITGGNDATMNVTNAYVQIGSTTSKPGAAGGKFTFNFENSIAEFTKEFGFYEPTGGVTPEFVMNIKDSIFTTGAKLCIAAANSKIVVDNSVVTLGTYLRNSGAIELKNGSVMTGSTIQFGENGGNNGAITVDNSTFTIVAGSTGSAFDGKGIGSITAQNGATVAVDYYKDMTINVDESSSFTTKVN